MSLEGKAETSGVLRGKINSCDVLTLSAYGIAVKNGFTGTEEEWLLSLQGGSGTKIDSIEIVNKTDNTYELQLHMGDGATKSGQFTIDTPTAEEVGAAPAGFGFGGKMNYVDMTSDDYSGMAFDDAIETVLATMPGYSCAQVQFYAPNDGYHGNKFVGKLWKYTANYVTLEAINYSGYKAIKRKTGGTWNPWEWENPPLVADTEYRTTERINSNAVYKMADAAGNVMYRLDGDSEWRSYFDLVGGNDLTDLIAMVTIPGSIGSGNSTSYPKGESSNSSSIDSTYSRTDYIPVLKGDVVTYSNLMCATNYSILAIYDEDKNCLSVTKGKGASASISGTVDINQNGFIRLSTKMSTISGSKAELLTRAKGNIVLRKTLNILVIGNSFSQDSFAYLPPVLNEILPDYCITYGVAYKDSTELPEQVTNIESGVAYNWFNYWDSTANAWDRQSDITFEDIMAKQKWDIIYLQPGGSSSDDSVIRMHIITPGRKLLRKMQALNGGPFSLMVGQHLAVSDTSFVKLCNGMSRAMDWLGIVDFIPIGTAFENARTHPDLNALGSTSADSDGRQGGNMLWLDGKHMHAGFPALLATYTIALKILKCVGESHRGIYGSHFVPTTDNCFAIGAANENGSMSGTRPMTHGVSVGVTEEYIKAAQEIANLAVNNPSVVTDCANIFP